MFENIKWIFFDVGSTLMDESKVYEHRFKDMADNAGVSYEEIYNTAMDFYHKNERGDIRTCKLYDLPRLVWYFEEEKLYPDAERVLKALKKNHKIGVIANQSLGTADRLKEHGILKYMDIVVASAEEGLKKPDPAIFKLALKRAGVNADEAVMIGDRIDNDIVPAKTVGMRTVWIRQGFGKFWHLEGEEQKPDKTIDSLTELLGIFIKGTHIVHPIPPTFDKDSKILILGSFPSVRSREMGYFYGHPQNRFWKVVAEIYNEPVPGTIEERKSFLLRNHIAAWDVIRSCTITGSSDASIKDVVPNDLSKILNDSKVTRIFVNGKKAEELYKKYTYKNTGIEAKLLPSTSPANAAWKLDRLIKEWKIIKEGV